MTTQPPRPANRQERSAVLASASILWLAVGTFVTVTKDIPYVNYSLGWKVTFGLFAGPTVILSIMSGYLQLADIKDLWRMRPRIRFEPRAIDHDANRNGVSHDQNDG